VSRTFFDLRDLNLATDLIALAIAACAGAVLTVFLALTHRLPGGHASPGGRASPAGHDENRASGQAAAMGPAGK